MGAGAAGHRHRTGQPGLGEADQVYRVHLALNQDEIPGRWRRRGASGEPGQHGVADLAHVVRACGEVRVGQRGDRGGLGGGRALDGGRGVRALHNRSHGRVHQRRIGRDQRADGDDAGLVAAPVVPQPLRQRRPFLCHGRERGRHLIRGGRTVTGVGVATVELPGRHPPGHGQAPVPAGLGHGPASVASRRALRISAVEAAPGSSWPTLRGPR